MKSALDGYLVLIFSFRRKRDIAINRDNRIKNAEIIK